MPPTAAQTNSSAFHMRSGNVNEQGLKLTLPSLIVSRQSNARHLRALRSSSATRPVWAWSSCPPDTGSSCSGREACGWADPATETEGLRSLAPSSCSRVSGSRIGRRVPPAPRRSPAARRRRRRGTPRVCSTPAAVQSPAPAARFSRWHWKGCNAYAWRADRGTIEPNRRHDVFLMQR